MSWRQRSSQLLLAAALTAFAGAAFCQTRPMLTFHVTAPDGTAVPDADVSVQSAEGAQAALVRVQGRPVTKFGLQAQHYKVFFATKTNGEGRAQAPKNEFQNMRPADKVVVTVRVPGYEQYRENVDLAEEKPVEIKLRPLPPPQ